MSKDEDFMSCYSTFAPDKCGPHSGQDSDAATCDESRWGKMF